MKPEETDQENNPAASETSAGDQPSSSVPCCSEEVHIAYRGKSDDRLYIAYNRKWMEVRYFQPNGLRAFCATCRHRVL